MPRSQCDFCCAPEELARTRDTFRTAELQILCAQLDTSLLGNEILDAILLQLQTGGTSGTQYEEGDVAPSVIGTAAMWRDVGDVMQPVTAATPLPVNVVAGGTSGVQYTDGDVDATVTGTAVMWKDAGNVITSVSSATPLPVAVISGGGGGVQYVEGVAEPSVTGTAAMWRDGAGDMQPVSPTLPFPVTVISGGGGGTQYLEGAAVPAVTGTALMWRDGSGDIQPVSPTLQLPVIADQGTSPWVVSGTVAATQSGAWILSANSGVDIGDVTVNNAAGAAAVNIQDGGNSITVDGTVAATQSGAWILSANSGVDIGDVTVNNAGGGAAVNIQDGGNSITVDGTVAISGSVTVTGTVAATQSGAWILSANSGVDIGDVTINNASGAAAVNIQDGGNSITVDGTVAATQSGAWILSANSGVDIGDVTINNAAGAAAVNIQDGGNTITVDGTITANAGTGNFATNLAQIAGNTVATYVVNLNTVGSGIQATGMVAAFDDVAPTTITEGQVGAVRMSNNRNLYSTLRDAAGNERGANVNASNELLVSASISAIIPGTTATSLGKAEDSIAGSGDTGVAIFGVINNTNATKAADGDYTCPSLDASGMSRVVGNVANDAVDAGDPVKIGFQARQTFPTAVADGDRVNGIADDAGRQVFVMNSVRDLTTDQGTTVSTTTETTIVTAVASTFNDLVLLVMTNTSSTSVRADIRDVTAGTVRFSVNLPARGGAVIPFNSPLKQATVNTAWTIQLSAAVTDVRILAQTVQNK